MVKRGSCVSSLRFLSSVLGLPRARSLSISRTLRRTALTMASGSAVVRTASSRSGGVEGVGQVDGRHCGIGQAIIFDIVDVADDGDAGTVVAAGNQTLSTTFTPTDRE